MHVCRFVRVDCSSLNFPFLSSTDTLVSTNNSKISPAVFYGFHPHAGCKSKLSRLGILQRLKYIPDIRSHISYHLCSRAAGL